MIRRQKLVGAVGKVAAGLATIFFASTAVADSVVTYSGYECMFATTTGNPSGPTEGAAFGGSTYTRCPLVRIASNSTTDISSIIIRVQDNSTTQSIECVGRSCTGAAEACSISSTAATGTSFTGTTFLDLGSMVAHSNGYAYIHCKLPNDAQSVVYSYRATD
jgi:hypothetical protein